MTETALFTVDLSMPLDVSIKVQETPNPNARKFVLDGVHFPQSMNFAAGEGGDHPLAAQLLAVEGVYNVLLAQDFVTVNKLPDVAWAALQDQVETILEDYITHGTGDAGQSGPEAA